MTSLNAFGRLRAPQDARDLRFLMRTAQRQIAAVVGKPKPRLRPYKDGALLDQGRTSQCVGYACRGFLDAAPLMSKATEGPSATMLYRQAQALDEWPGEAYEGTSVRGGLKALVASGHVASYVWGQTVDELVAWMNGGYGTCIVGTNWYQPMSEVDHAGFMRESASNLDTPIGGHAWRLIWWDAKRQGFLMRNSWNHDFGWITRGVQSGYAYVRRDFLTRLLREEGECASPTQVRVTATPI